MKEQIAEGYGEYRRGDTTSLDDSPSDARKRKTNSRKTTHRQPSACRKGQWRIRARAYRLSDDIINSDVVLYSFRHLREAYQMADHLMAKTAAESIPAARRAAAARRRRIILNNDGNEPVYLIREPTAEEILAYRTAPFVGSQVDTVFYCTWCSGFGLFTHFTEVGQVFTTTEEMFSTNRMKDLLAVGVDPLAVMNTFCHDHEIEFFWSMRMNDTHDGQHADYGPVMLRANQLKTGHPEYLIGGAENPPRYGAWTAVDYGIPEVRELAFRYVQEVCRNYDVDGVELDFFRHPVYFRGPALGFACSRAELEAMSTLVRRIRVMMDAEGEKRGRPLLLAVKTPDSVPFCRDLGLDIEGWFAAGLVDVHIPSGYIQLNSWEYSVELAHRYGIQVYPSLDESRVKEEGTHDVNSGVFTTPRGAHETYRARAANVWASGADGVCLYNYFDPKSPILHEIGSPDSLRARDKQYFVSYRGVGRVASDTLPHEQHLNIPTLNPHHPTAIESRATACVSIRIHEDMDATQHGAATPCARLYLSFDRASDVTAVTVSFNSVALTPAPDDGTRGADPHPEDSQRAGLHVEFPVPLSALRQGANTIAVANGTPSRLLLRDVMVRIAYQAH